MFILVIMVVIDLNRSDSFWVSKGLLIQSPFMIMKGGAVRFIITGRRALPNIFLFG